MSFMTRIQENYWTWSALNRKIREDEDGLYDLLPISKDLVTTIQAAQQQTKQNGSPDAPPDEVSEDEIEEENPPRRGGNRGPQDEEVSWCTDLQHIL